MHYIFPSPIRQMTMGHHYSYLGFVDKKSRIFQTVRHVQVPLRMANDLAKPDAILQRRKYSHRVHGDLLIQDSSNLVVCPYSLQSGSSSPNLTRWL
jgi:hypothetical protein